MILSFFYKKCLFATKKGKKEQKWAGHLEKINFLYIVQNWLIRFFSYFALSQRALCTSIWHYLQQKVMTQFSLIFKKPFFDPFSPQNSEMRFFPKNRTSSLLSIYDPLTPCKKLEKNNEPIPRKVRHERTNQPTNQPTDKHEFIGPFCQSRGPIIIIISQRFLGRFEVSSA